jgi:hypothetical protein
MIVQPKYVAENLNKIVNNYFVSSLVGWLASWEIVATYCIDKPCKKAVLF